MTQLSNALNSVAQVTRKESAFGMYNEDLDGTRTPDHPDVQTQRASATHLATEQDQPASFSAYVARANQKHKRSTKSIVQRNAVKTEETNLEETLKQFQKDDHFSIIVGKIQEG
jgi:hypothetical protein